ncbi:fimbrillin family protein [uncultured Prevotella sp.]|uniref:leucine-rich repeat protein n=1 Tax=uncultured Prevotella sp. TaxID=159272 RepID=UPI0025D48437|nr:fimbrillin family protein [uncultured Prevotella sp.]
MIRKYINFFIYIAITVCVVLCAGCADGLFCEDGTQHHTQRIELSGEIDQVAVTRVNDGGFCDGDGMGIYIVDYKADIPGTLQQSGNRADNVCYTYDEANRKWNSDQDVYWKDNHTHIDVYGYYPYANPESIDNYTFNVQRDQYNATADSKMSGYEASDFLWGKLSDVAPTSAALRLLLRHRMSSACVKLLKGEGFTESEWESIDKMVFATNLARKASINMTDGTVKVAGDVESSATIPLQVNDEWRAIVVPQTVPAGTTLFSITIGGAHYKFAKNEALTYVSGKMMKFNIRVDKTEGNGKYRLTLVSESIAPWENDLQSHDATATEYVVINSTAGHLKDSIAASHKDIAMVKRMKVTGTINLADFIMMRDSMPRLTALNLKDVRIKRLYSFISGGVEHFTDYAQDDALPVYCLKGKKTLTSFVFPDVLKRINSRAFDGAGLKGSLNIPEGVVEIRERAFADNDFTGVLTLPSTLKKIGDSAFSGCLFNCPLNLPDGIEEIGSECFWNCRNLYGNLILPSHLKKIGSRAFNGCAGLKGDLVIPKSLTVIPSYAFYICKFEGRLQLHDGITDIGTHAFYGNGFIGELELPKSLVGLGDGNFYGNYFSGSFKIPKGLLSISSAAFANCAFTGEAEIPEGVTCIHSSGFSSCINLQKIILPSSLEVIDVGAFQYCESLRVVECKSTVPPVVNDGAFDGVPLENLTVIVPGSALNDYKSSESWSGFKNIIAK